MNNQQILEMARRAWNRMEPARRRRERHTRYTYGDQWADPVRLRDGRTVTEGTQIAMAGRPPLTNNLIRRLVKSVVGRYRQTAPENALNPVPETVKSMNRLDELDARTFEEFLISGMAVHYVCAENRPGGSGVWVDNVPPDRFFINAVLDPRCNDMEMAGRLLDMSIAEIVMRFAPDDRSRARRIRALYESLADLQGTCADDTATAPLSFSHARPGRCRVIEVWTLECSEMLRVHDRMEASFCLLPAREEPRLKRLAQKRRRAHLPALEYTAVMQAGWHGRFLAPDGTLLGELSSPFPDGRPPFAVKLYPLVDGDVHSLVGDVIDQQKYVNRLITTLDHMMGTAAKGVLLFPIQSKPDNLKWDDVARLWADPGGIIPYRPQGGVSPQQVVTPMTDTGARDMLQTQIQLFEDVSGVGSVLMGKSVGGAVGAERYETEVRNATASISDLFETFRDFTGVRNALVNALSVDDKL